MVVYLFKKFLPSCCGQQNKKIRKSEKESFHPELQAGCLSKLFLCWTFLSLKRSFAKGFKDSDLFDPMPHHNASSLADKLEKKWFFEVASKDKPSLWRTLFKIFASEFFAVGIFIFINEFVVKISQSVLIWKLITTHVAKNEQEHEVYLYACLIIVCSFLNALICNWCIFSLQKLAMKIRIACSSLIYRKSLRLDKNAVHKIATGQIVNLLSNDLNRFNTLLLQIHYLWAAPLESMVVLYLLQEVLNWTATVGVGLFFIFVPIQIIMGEAYSKFRLKTALKTDERVGLTNEIVSGIQMIKMYTWEELFIKFTKTLRRQEIRYIRGTTYLKAIQNALNKFLSKGAVFLCILVYILTGNHLQSRYVFVIKSFYNVLKQSMTTNFPEAVKNTAEVLVALKRIEDFLLSEEIKSTPESETETGIFLKRASARWPSSARDNLSQINFGATLRQLVTIVGPVGSGKTSLIKAMLQELPLKEGTLAASGTISYACQEAWLFAGTIKENILFGQALDPARYEEVVEVCALNHDFKLLPFGDGSIVGDRGITLSGGQKARINLARAVYRRADIYILDDPLAAVDASVGKQLFEQCIVEFLKEKCVILTTHQVQYLQQSHKIYLLQGGKIATAGDYQDIRNCGKHFDTILQSEAELENSSNYDFQTTARVENGFVEGKNFGQIPMAVYREYLMSGGCLLFSLTIVLTILAQIVESGTDYFESYWVKLEEKSNETVAKPPHFISDNCIYIYSALISLVLIFSILTSILFYSYFINTSIKLHDDMFSAIIKAKLQFFFTNPAGAILNRFSKDLGTADTTIPKALIDTVQNGLNVLAIFVLVAVVSPEMLPSSIILLLLFYFLRKFYLTTSRELKRIEATSRSPIYSHLSESLCGLETIRAFKVQQKQQQTFDRLVNRHTSAFYMYVALSIAFRLWLSLFCSLYVALVTASCFWGRELYGGDLGLVITQSTSLADLLNWGMIQWSEFENEMTCVERIVEFKNTESEDDAGSAKTWPESSSIRFREVTLRYKANVAPALNKISFTIAPREKIGVVGRTGAGKTSIISALFRLVEFEGAIFIGGVNIKDVALEFVRSNISIIPQDPVLFSGTVRENLDPFNRFPDCDLWAILDDLDLKSLVDHLPDGLESKIHEKGSNLSVGQRQLFCLARALLRKNKILVLDEATANIDYHTDSLIQATIKKKLVDCTVLIIAHRLQTIIDCDKVLVMDGGKVLEFDHPYKLLEDEGGALYGLVSKTGPTMTAQLKNIAEKVGKKELVAQ